MYVVPNFWMDVVVPASCTSGKKRDQQTPVVTPKCGELFLIEIVRIQHSTFFSMFASPINAFNMSRKSPFDLSKCARPNILKLQPYRCARE